MYAYKFFLDSHSKASHCYLTTIYIIITTIALFTAYTVEQAHSCICDSYYCVCGPLMLRYVTSVFLVHTHTHPHTHTHTHTPRLQVVSCLLAKHPDCLPRQEIPTILALLLRVLMEEKKFVQLLTHAHTCAQTTCVHTSVPKPMYAYVNAHAHMCTKAHLNVSCLLRVHLCLQQFYTP